MVITAIKTQVKRPERVSVFVDGKYDFSLSQGQLLDCGIRVGLQIDQRKLDDLREASNFGKLYERVLGYIALRPRSVKEVRDYCWRRKASEQDAAQITEKLIAKRYLNDRDFARCWAESRRLTKPTSVRKLQAELASKGVAASIVAEVLAGIDYSDDEPLAKLLAKKRRLSRYRQDEQKLVRYLVGQGFSYGQVRQAISQVAEEPELF